jgi:biotin operon repressor
MSGSSAFNPRCPRCLSLGSPIGLRTGDFPRARNFFDGQLSVLKKRRGLSQNRLGEQLGIDRSNAFDVVQRLNRAGLICFAQLMLSGRALRQCTNQLLSKACN